MIKESEMDKLKKMKEELTYVPTKGNRFGDYKYGGLVEDGEDHKPKLKNEDGLRYPSIDNLLEV
ncbi:MAG TPA: hypothetical protein VJ878_00855, partial [Candidatus Izemoplasmatales bacterium]|nr:hypothetical protein [Candidatus Izemoplasmatales bacterium]